MLHTRRFGAFGLAIRKTLPERNLTMTDMQAVLPVLLNEQLSYPCQTQWHQLCKALLESSDPQLDPGSPDVPRLKSRLLTHVKENNLPYENIPMSRPFYRQMATTLEECQRRQGRLPDSLRTNPVPLLAMTNTHRIEQLEAEMTRLFSDPPSQDQLRHFLFEFLTPNDVRIFLRLRTTAGGQTLDVMPPSLDECLYAFSKVYVKASAKPSRVQQQHKLTVGAKALSKHWHRDQRTGFWGVCTGTEDAKNEHAERILVSILGDAVWINLHSLPHDETAYEIRQSQGYGVRWSKLAEGDWLFRGFLEPQMENGHSVGWRH
ncbi:hypothetical protein BCR43DRAFT_81292 [Syncephalastrum racemosum]|uniref:Uncharacterized protein n=1 Tax=Syncephalastrum racemosum TaxID=13706 RepID=A0A1X2H2V5_SYNRA|nr:hypothetical protein BCR43DRAFT_81292 [Syncephalastrum racemosum]